MTKEHGASSGATPAVGGTEAVEPVKAEVEAKPAYTVVEVTETDKVAEAAKAEAAKAAKAAKAEARKSYMQKMSTFRLLSKDEAERYETETGMHRDDIKEIANTALLNNMILSFREVSKAAAEKMEHENAAGKPMNIKAKSATDGPAAVFVPMPQAFGKVGTKVDMNDPAAVRHAKDLITKLEEFTKKSLKASKDKLSAGTQDKTEKFLHVDKKPLLTKQGEQIYGFIIDRLPTTDRYGRAVENPTNGLPYRTLVDKGELVFAVKRNNEEFFDINDPNKPLFRSFGAKAVPIEILTLTEYIADEIPGADGKFKFVLSDRAKVKVEQPIVGDYDQFTIGLDKNYTKDSGRGETHTRYQSSLGVGTEVDIAVSVALIEGTKDRMGVQHGAEIANPYPEPLAGVTFFIPEGDAVKVVICKNEQMILDIYNQYSDRFDLPVNPLWGWTRDDSGKLVVDPERIDAMALAIANKHFIEHINAYEQQLIDQLGKANEAHNAELSAEIETKLNAVQTFSLSLLKLSNDLEMAYRKLGDAKAAPKDGVYIGNVARARGEFNNIGKLMKESITNAREEFPDLAAQIPNSHLLEMVDEARARAARPQPQQQAPKPSLTQPSIKEPEASVNEPLRQHGADERPSFVAGLLRRASSAAHMTLTPKSKATPQTTPPTVEMTSMKAKPSMHRNSISPHNPTLPAPHNSHVDGLNPPPHSDGPAR